MQKRVNFVFFLKKRLFSHQESNVCNDDLNSMIRRFLYSGVRHGCYCGPGTTEFMWSKTQFFCLVFGFCLITGPCERERQKAQCTLLWTNSMADSLTVGLTPCWDFSACCWEMKVMPSICCIHDLDTFLGFSFSPEVLGHQHTVGYQIPPFWLILETYICKHFYFPTLTHFFTKIEKAVRIYY